MTEFNPLGKLTLDQLADLLQTGVLPEDLVQNVRLAVRLREELKEACDADPAARDAIRAKLVGELAQQDPTDLEPPARPSGNSIL